MSHTVPELPTTNWCAIRINEALLAAASHRPTDWLGLALRRLLETR